MGIENIGSVVSGGINDEGGELIASFNYNTSGKKIEQQFEAGDYLVTLYGPTNSNVRIYSSDSNGDGAFLAQLDITQTGEVQILTLPADIVRLLVVGTEKGSIVIRKMSDVADGTLTTLPDISSWSLLSTAPDNLIGRLASNGTRVIGSRTGGSSNLYYVSDDSGASWTERNNLPSSKSDSAIAYGQSNRWVIATENTGAFYYRRSTDNGETWTDGSYNYNGYGNIGVAGMASQPGTATMIAVSKQYGVYASFRTSNAGSSWNFYALPNNNNNYCCISYAGGYWFAPGFQGNNLAYSTTGVSWANATSNVPNKGGVVGFKDGTYYLPNGGAPGLGGGSSSTIHVTTEDPGQENWTTRNLPISAYWGQCSVIGDDIILHQHASGGNYPGEILTSTDGITWTRRTAPDAAVAEFIKPEGGTIMGGTYSSSTAENLRIIVSGSSYGVS